MLTIIGRTLIILLVAGVVALGWYALSTTSAAQSLFLDRPEGRPGIELMEGQPSQAAPEGAVPDRMHRGERPGEAGEIFSLTRALAGIARNLVITLVVTMVVILLGKLVRVLRPAEVRSDV